MASAAESPLLFSLRVSPALAQPQLALRLLAGRQVDHRPLALPLVRLALRPDPPRRAAWLEVYERQVAHALFRLAPRRGLHRQVACQADRSSVVLLALCRRDAHARRDRLAVGCHHAQFRKLYRALVPGCLPDHRSVQAWGLGRTCFGAGSVQAMAATDGRMASVS